MSGKTTNVDHRSPDHTYAWFRALNLYLDVTVDQLNRAFTAHCVRVSSILTRYEICLDTPFNREKENDAALLETEQLPMALGVDRAKTLDEDEIKHGA